jgi:hypothetical protein
MIRIVIALIIFTGVSLSAPLKYCIQVAAEKRFELIKASFQKVKDYPKARIERRGDLYLLRVGAEDRKQNLYLMLRKIRAYFPDAFIKKCEIKEDYVVFPITKKEEEVKEESKEEKKGKPSKPQKTENERKEGKPPQKDTTLTEDREIKELLISIRNELSIIRSEIKKLQSKKEKQKESEENPAYFEKFLYSVGIFTGGLFFFTWILLILLYRKVGASNVENANLLNDMFKLIKVLNLLSKGQIIKMENGKLFIYDRKNERWREAD